MKRFLLTATSVVMACTGAHAASQQNPYANMGEQDIQRMQAGIQQMMKCIDEAGGQQMLQKIAVRGEEMNAKLEGLCKAGKRDQAEQEAITFGKEMSEGADTRKLMQCGEMGKQMLESVNFKLPDPTDTAALHLCDGYNQQ